MNKINVKNLFRLSQNKQVRPLTFLLANKNRDILGQIENFTNVTYHPQLSSADELSFSVYKILNGETCDIWERLINFKLIYVKEYNEWFEITVELDDTQTTPVKNITATALCEAELSHVLMDTTEINTETDIARSDYVNPTIFYNPEDPSSSLLNRVVLKKMSNYYIAHVDETLYSLQRTFTFDNTTSIYDAMQTIAEEIGCLFLFDTNDRGIYAYDLQYMCLDCDYRSDYEFTTCPNCGSTLHIRKPYGYDTNIYIDKEQLGQNITLSSDTDSVKNCIKVYGGDDVINAAIINANPNGSNYIYAFDDDTLEDMPDSLVDKLNEYTTTVEEYRNEREYEINSTVADNYNAVIDKITQIYEDTEFTEIDTTLTGYSTVMARYYETVDLILYLKSSMMPTPTSEEKTAASEGAKIEEQLTVVAVGDASSISLATADSSCLLMAKAIADTSLYKITVTENSSSILSQTWSGSFTLTSYAKDEDGDPEDTYTTAVISVTINDDMEEYLNQKIEKIIAKLDTQGVKDIFSIETLEEFRTEVKKYSYNMLNSYLSAYQSALDVLTQQGISESNNTLYSDLYLPYYNRFKILESEMNVRAYDIDCIESAQEILIDYINSAHYYLNFERFLGADLYNLFLAYRREDTFENSNYVSDGLSNAEIFELVDNLIQVAKDSVLKSAETQYSVNITLINLMLILGEDRKQIYENFLENFILGNYIRVKIDGKLYKMRMGDVTIDYSNLNTLSMTFYDISKTSVSTTVSRAKQLLEQTKSMTTNFSTVKRQAEQGEDADRTFAALKQDGLDLAQYSLFNTNSEITFDVHGLLARNYDDIKEQYTDEQLRLNGNSLIFTDTNWLTTRMALGKQYYYLNNVAYEEYGVNSDFVLAGKIIGGDIYSQNYTANASQEITNGTHINLNDGTFAFAGGDLSFDGSTLYVDGTIESADGHIGGWTIGSTTLKSNNNSIVLDAGNNKIYSGTHSTLASTTNGYYLASDGLSIGSTFRVSSSGALTASSVDLTGKITATSGNIGSLTITSNDGVYCGAGSSSAGIGMNGHSYAFWAGTSYGNSGNAPFRVGHDGSLYASSATITGNIYANGGSINGSLVTSGINADNITSGTISSDRIDANTVVANGINSVSINADNITTGTLSTDRISHDGSGSINIANLTASGIVAISGSIEPTFGNGLKMRLPQDSTGGSRVLRQGYWRWSASDSCYYLAGEAT